ncbi:retrovirus-related pol polyprotein from transposon TNT 1-94 [Tanacetum coccineum]
MAWLLFNKYKGDIGQSFAGTGTKGNATSSGGGISAWFKEKTLLVQAKNLSDFGKCFVPQMQLSAEQAFWLSISNPISKQLVVQTTLVRAEAPSELQMPPKNPLPTKVAKTTTPYRNNPEMLKDVTNISSSSRSNVVESYTSNHSEASQNWGSNVSTAPSSSLVNFRFGKDRIAKKMDYGDYQMGNVTISWVYYVEGLGHNLFSVGQFYDSDLEVAFRKHTCYIRDLEGVDLLKGSRGSNLYTLSLEDMMLSSPICLLSKASKTKSWLWHRRLSHLNFDSITALAKQGLVCGLPKLKF